MSREASAPRHEPCEIHVVANGLFSADEIFLLVLALIIIVWSSGVE